MTRFATQRGFHRGRMYNVNEEVPVDDGEEPPAWTADAPKDAAPKEVSADTKPADAQAAVRAKAEAKAASKV